MKKSILLILFSLSLNILLAEDSNKNTKIENAVNTKGFLFKEEIYSIENLSYFRLDPVKITNLESFNIVSGLRAIQKISIGKERKIITNYIDFEEISSIITSLQYMKTILKSKTVPGSYSEIKFCSKSGFLVRLQTVLNLNNKLDWNFSVQINTDNDKTFIQLQNDDIDRLLKIFEQAKAKL